MVFADFDEDGTGDMILGLDDDGDAGAAWLYKGQGNGAFDMNATKAFDLNPFCNQGCSDDAGVTGNARAFDLNVDGKMDVVVGYRVCPGDVVSPCYAFGDAVDSKIVVFWGNGDGIFQPGQQILYFTNSLAGEAIQIPQRLCPW
jgi:hypothetical protein